MKIGLFSTFADKEAYDLVNAVQDSVSTGKIPDSEISFVFSNRDIGENPTTDRILGDLIHRRFPLIKSSAYKFDTRGRVLARIAESGGDERLIKDWRNRYGEEIQRKLPDTDIDLLLGDMWIWGDRMVNERTAYNLHPALPGGPKGEWYKVIWDLIEQNEEKAGVMMHKLTPELDEGPPVSFAEYSIRGPEFDYLWPLLPPDPEHRQMVIDHERSLRGKTRHPLHKEIREKGFAREIPLVIQTTKALAEGRIEIEGGAPVDLTWEVDQALNLRLQGIEGQSRKEVN